MNFGGRICPSNNREQRTMKTSIILPIAALLLSFSMANAQEAPLPSELRNQISEWRINALPTLTPEAYWSELKELGSRVGEVNARRIEASESSDADSAIALMAYKAWSQPQKIEEIAGWYGVYEGQVSRELRGVDSDEAWEAMQAGFNAKRTITLVEALREQHKRVEFLAAWEAWMLSPHSHERHTMRQRMNEALAAIGNKRSIAILVEKCRVLPTHGFDMGSPSQRLEESRRDAAEIRNTIRAIGGKAAVLGLLECAHIAESDGYGGEGTNSARYGVVILLSSSYNSRQLQEMPEWAQSLRDPDNPDQLVPWDDKWKEFKPIIEGMLQDPKDLRAEDIRLLQDVLAAMPRN